MVASVSVGCISPTWPAGQARPSIAHQSTNDRPITRSRKVTHYTNHKVPGNAGKATGKAA